MTKRRAKTTAGDELTCSRTLLRPCLLLLLHEDPDHGYNLVPRLKELGVPFDDVGPVYHVLKRLEAEGLVVSSWEASAGPARRVYAVTPAGQLALGIWSERLLGVGQVIARYSDRYRTAKSAAAG